MTNASPPRRGKTKPPEMSDEALELVARRFRALGSSSRLRILHSLMGTDCSISELVEATGLKASNLSRHLSDLEQEGCIRRVRDGKEVIVSLIDESLRDLCELVCGALQQKLDTHRSALPRRRSRS